MSKPYAIYRMTKDMYTSIRYQNGRTALTHVEIIEYVNETFHLLQEVIGIETYVRDYVD